LGRVELAAFSVSDATVCGQYPRVIECLPMPSVEWNRTKWGATYAWPNEGDEWSAHWGATHALWSFVLFPRIGRFLPAETVLEIAPGFGRFTSYLKQYSERLIAVDINPKCIEACRQKFGDEVEFHVNDGRSLGMIADNSVDFVFSFDSLVHVDAEDLDAYVSELGRKLKVGGHGFIHHSNLGAYARLTRFTKAVSRTIPSYRIGKWLRQTVLIADCWRAENMTARRFVDLCQDHGLACTGQELVNWENHSPLIDCFSSFVRPAIRNKELPKVIANPNFMRQAEEIKQLSELY
jgi:ubiquinone/menaquinone biosynthesis C-methylase UbiE